MSKLCKRLSPPLIDNVFKLRPIFKSVYNGAESISYLGPKIWDILSEKIKKIKNLVHFKNEIRNWKPNTYPCR